MKSDSKDRSKLIIDLEKLNTMNSDGCPGCGGKFTLGETAVLTHGDWTGGPKYIHEQEAVFDRNKCIYVQRKK